MRSIEEPPSSNPCFQHCCLSSYIQANSVDPRWSISLTPPHLCTCSSHCLLEESIQISHFLGNLLLLAFLCSHCFLLAFPLNSNVLSWDCLFSLSPVPESVAETWDMESSSDLPPLTLSFLSLQPSFLGLDLALCSLNLTDTLINLAKLEHHSWPLLLSTFLFLFLWWVTWAVWWVRQRSQHSDQNNEK